MNKAVLSIFLIFSVRASEKNKKPEVAHYKEITQREAAIVMAVTRQRVKLIWCSIL